MLKDFGMVSECDAVDHDFYVVRPARERFDKLSDAVQSQCNIHDFLCTDELADCALSAWHFEIWQRHVLESVCKSS